MVDIDRWYDGGERQDDRRGDTKAAIDSDPTYVDIYKGKSATLLPQNAGVKCLLALRNNIPNFSQTSGSSGRYNDANFVFMPEVDVDPGDRIIAEDGSVFYITFINPEQKWSIEVQVINYSRVTV